MGILEGRTGLVVGVANKRSIAWACAQALHAQGMRLAFSYVNERLEKPVRRLAEELDGSVCFPCDVTREQDIPDLFESVGEEFGGLDTFVHAVASAKREDLAGDFFETSKEGYMLAHEISAYSLTSMCRSALPLMEGRPGSIVTLTYMGSERVVKNYNVMGVAKAALESSVRYLAADLGEKGIRVNAISAGPINTLAARGISGFTDILGQVAERAPLKRNVETEEVAGTSVFLASDLSSGITGEVIYVDCGYNIVGL